MILCGRQHISDKDLEAVTFALRSDFLTQGPQRLMRWSLTAHMTQDLKLGEVISLSAIRSVRPGCGAPPKFKFYDRIVSKRARTRIQVNTAVRLEDVE